MTYPQLFPMVDDLGEYGDLFMARDMLARLRKYFGLGDHIQANAAREALRNFTVDMRNIPKYVQKWWSTILALRAERYPIGYIDTVLNFVRNLPEEDHGWLCLCGKKSHENAVGIPTPLTTTISLVSLITSWISTHNGDEQALQTFFTS